MRKASSVPAENHPGAKPIPPALIAAVAALLGTHLFLGYRFIQSSAATYDEPVHLAAGYSYWMTGRYRLNIMDHPPLAEMWGSIPLLWLRPRLFLSHPDWLAGRLYHYSDYFLYHNDVGHEAMLRAARLFSFFTWTGLLAAAVLSWARRGAGAAGLAAAAFVYAFSPPLISNLALVTTDGGSAVLFFCAFWLASHPRFFSDGRIAALAGACAGAACAAKFNMIILAPMIMAFLWCDWRFLRNSAPAAQARLPWKSLALFLGCGLFILAAAYRFDQFGLFWEGLSSTWNRMGQGRSAFFFGRHSVTGFWPYFPVALAIKTPLAVWALAAAGVWAMISEARHATDRRRAASKEYDLSRGAWRICPPGAARDSLWLVAPPVLYMAAAMCSKVQIGYRHVLPVVPFVLVWAARGAAELWNRRRAWSRVLAAGLAAWLAGSVLRASPYYLAYFNEAVGGPSRGWRCLTDSNLDWGQDLKGLGEAVAALGGPPVYLSYFGTADPAAYGLHYLPVGFITNVDRRGDAADPSASGRALFAVSATNLQGTYYEDSHVYDWLKERRPLDIVGHSIFLYDLTGDSEGRRRLAHVLESAGDPGAARRLLLK